VVVVAGFEVRWIGQAFVRHESIQQIELGPDEVFPANSMQ
jgi:hypothetical protein